MAAEQLVQSITRHRQFGRAALLAGDLNTAFEELWAARELEPDLDELGATARMSISPDWEIETDLTPLARALSARLHPRATETWRRILDDRPARSIRAEAAEWLARDAFGSASGGWPCASCTQRACSATPQNPTLPRRLSTGRTGSGARLQPVSGRQSGRPDHRASASTDGPAHRCALVRPGPALVGA